MDTVATKARVFMALCLSLVLALGVFASAPKEPILPDGSGSTTLSGIWGESGGTGK